MGVFNWENLSFFRLQNECRFLQMLHSSWCVIKGWETCILGRPFGDNRVFKTQKLGMIPLLIWKNIWFLCTLCWVVFFYPLCPYPISISASMLHYCSSKFPKQYFSLSLTSSSPEQNVIWNFPTSETRFLSSSHFALTSTSDSWLNERNSSIPLKLSLSRSLSHLPWATTLPHYRHHIFHCHL